MAVCGSYRVGQPSAATLGALLFTLLAGLAPVAVARYPSLVDFPNHLARHYIGASIGSSGDLQRYYEYEWRPVANLAGDALFVPLNLVFSPLGSERIIVGVAIAAWILAPIILHRAIWERWSCGPCLGGLVVYNASLRGGLENFLIASALSIMTFALWVSWRSRPTPLRIALFGALATTVYFGHLLAFVVLGLLVAPFEIQKAMNRAVPLASRLGRLMVSAVAFIPGVALFIAFNQTARAAGNAVTSFGGWHSRLEVMLSAVLMYHPLPDLLAYVGLLGVLAWRLSGRDRVVHPSLALVLLALSVASLLAPSILFDIRAIHIRLPPILCAVLVGAIDWRLSDRHWKTVGSIFVVAMLLRSASVTKAWLQHGEEVDQLRAGFAELVPGAMVLAAADETADTGEFHWFSLSYAVVDKQIFTPSLYFDIHMLGVDPAYRRLSRLVALPVEISDLPYPGGPENMQTQPGVYWNTWWKDFSHLLVYSREPKKLPFERRLKLISKGSFFRLYQIVDSEGAMHAPSGCGHGLHDC